jgi:hypothetical protein
MKEKNVKDKKKKVEKKLRKSKVLYFSERFIYVPFQNFQP